MKRSVVIAVVMGAAAVGGLWYAQNVMTGAVLPDAGAPGGPIAEPAGPQEASSPMAQQALELSSRERAVSDVLTEAQHAELSDDQIRAFEEALAGLRGSPAERPTWEKLEAFERSFPLFAASEDALFKCLKGRAKSAKACEPSPEYRKLLDEGARNGAISKDEAAKDLEILASLKNPKTQPALPPGGLDFWEKESAMKVQNFRKIADAVRRAQETR
ncbi:MAG TPA: hypothetical protein VNI01_05850 [Elusimicrobiota bacterium]|jgi:hypothetical protein|nr:hypothetical protein [Elusimicrobiota bacterium]